MAELRLEGVAKRFGAVQAVHDLDLTVASGEFVVLLGPSGAGKTTTLRLAAGLERADRGRVFIGGHDASALAPALRDVTFVFQQYSLYPHLNVFDNLAFPLRSPLRPRGEDEVRRKVTEVARLLRIEDKLDSPATRLSGGQMQRVAIARALAMDPDIVLADEPTGNLDTTSGTDIMGVFLDLWRQGSTLVVITHDMALARRASRIVEIRDGRIVSDRAAEEAA